MTVAKFQNLVYAFLKHQKVDTRLKKPKICFNEILEK